MRTRNPQETRNKLLKIAFNEIHIHGFQGMRVDEVLRISGLNKGAFYHHFNSKKALGLAVIKEQIKPLLEKIWLEPLTKITNPIIDLPEILFNFGNRVPQALKQHGCPLNNIAQEMSSLDSNFQVLISSIFNKWINALEEVFEKGKNENYIHDNVDCNAAARFTLAILEGCIGLSKAENSSNQVNICYTQIKIYLQALGSEN